MIARLLTGIHEDQNLRELFLERYYRPRRVLARQLIQEAIDADELPKDTDPEIVIDALHGPQFFRLIMGHAPLTKNFAESLCDIVLG